ncbi:unnamed protein product [Ilex paraguariensis]|uniref:Leucine-rich repeat-containing N-terminal plant-type domain-containing protein n=1 Tax=Ilex paraguariensis TaxID=185542 RepID=A0ABC8SZY9_9AQUA
MICFCASPTNLTDQFALLVFKNFTRDTNNVLTNNWTISTSFCNWIGVTCSPRRQRVTALILPELNLQGTISQSITNLSFLAVLNLGNNFFQGILPSGLGLLPRLRVVDVHNNQLEGSVPLSLFRNQKLQTISLAYNQFSGGLLGQPWNLPQFRILNLTSMLLLYLGCVENSIGGDIPWELGNLFNLKMLGFDFNNLVGEIPQAIFNISSLIYIAFTANRLSGHIPETTGLQLPNLEGIFLADNQLT